MELKDLNVLRAAVERFVGLTDVEWQMLVPDLRYRNLTRGEQWICGGPKEQSHLVGFLLQRRVLGLEERMMDLYSIKKTTS